jgi:hypothetical protein
VEVAEAVRQERPQEWSRVWASWFLVEDNAANLDLAARGLAQAGSDRQLEDALDTVFRNHLQHPARLIWACEAMTDESAPEAAVRRRLTLSLLERSSTCHRPISRRCGARQTARPRRAGYPPLLETAFRRGEPLRGSHHPRVWLEVERVRLVEGGPPRPGIGGGAVAR